MSQSCLAALAVAVATAHAPAAQPTQSEEIRPIDEWVVTPGYVCGKVQQFAADLERLRLMMGRPKVGAPLFEVENVGTNNVLEIAGELLAKTNQRANEFGIGSWALSPRDGRPASPAEVLAVVETAHRQLRRIGERLGLALNEREFPVDDSMTENDVIEEIFQCNRQLNLLMEEPLAPSEVYSKVSLAITYIRSIKGEQSELAFGERVRFERHKLPSDVYGRLRETNQLVCQIGRHMGVVTPTLVFREETNIEPSDVHDLAVLILTNLRAIDAVVNEGSKASYALHYPGPRFPSHVYQRVGTLNVLVEELIAKLDCHEMTTAEAQP